MKPRNEAVKFISLAAIAFTASCSSNYTRASGDEAQRQRDYAECKAEAVKGPSIGDGSAAIVLAPTPVLPWTMQGQALIDGCMAKKGWVKG